MAKTKDTPRQEAVPDLAKFGKTLYELSNHFVEEIKPHRNNLYLLSELITGDFISGGWADDIAYTFSEGIEKILMDAVSALNEFEERLSSTSKTHREKNKEYYESRHKENVEETKIAMAVNAIQGLSPEKQVKVVEYIHESMTQALSNLKAT